MNGDTDSLYTARRLRREARRACETARLRQRTARELCAVSQGLRQAAASARSRVPFPTACTSLRAVLIGVGETPSSALMRFVDCHSGHGWLHGDTSEPTALGCLLSAACECGAVFERWITPEDAVRDVVATDVLTTPN